MKYYAESRFFLICSNSLVTLRYRFCPIRVFSRGQGARGDAEVLREWSRLMFGGTGFARPVAVVAFVLGLASPAAAGDPVCKPVSGYLVSTPASDPAQNPALRSLSGVVAPFGKVRGSLLLDVDQSTGQFVGVFSLEGKNGTVSGTLTGQFLSATTYLERITFTGGTGAFSGITGGVLLAGMIDPDTGTGYDLILSGQACFPK